MRREREKRSIAIDRLGETRAALPALSRYKHTHTHTTSLLISDPTGGTGE